MREILYVFIGSGLGGVLRYCIMSGLKLYNYRLPIHTIIANGFACLLVGMTIGYTLDNDEDNLKRIFIAIGICGGLSTYSSFSYELLRFIQNQEWLFFILYASLTFTICLLLTYIGYALGLKLSN